MKHCRFHSNIHMNILSTHFLHIVFASIDIPRSNHRIVTVMAHTTTAREGDWRNFQSCMNALKEVMHCLPYVHIEPANECKFCMEENKVCPS